MCGIFGKTNSQDGDRCLEALKSFSYRGPDHTGYSTVEDIFLGNNRLSVIDVDDRSNQPIVYFETGCRIVFNGEIYNYSSLRKELIDLSCTFRTNSDTEVILVGYKKFGPSFFSKLQGMFAFAIHDLQKSKLILARDQVGIKPLIYTETNDGLLFSSEMKGILKALDFKPKISKAALNLYLGKGIIPSPLTLFEDIYKLEAGKILEFCLEKKKIETIYSIAKNRDLEIDKTFEETLTNAITDQLVSDVPIGVFFSGGIDSSLIAATLKNSGIKLKAFSLQIDDKFGDALYAKKIADTLDLDTKTLHFGVKEFEVAYSEIKHKFDEPTLDSSLVALYAISKVAAREVKVVLSGEGADELFYGYERQLEIAKMRPVMNITGVINLLNRHLPIFKGRPRIFKHLYRHLSSKYSYYLYATSPTISPINWDLWTDFYKKNQITPEEIDLKVYLENDLLRKIDFATSYASIEGRVPFLDMSLFFDSQKFAHKSLQKEDSKFLLKNMLLRFLPKQYIYRPKSGMGLPMVKIFQESEILNTDLEHAIDFLKKEPEISDYLPKNVQWSKLNEPYFCYMLVTLYLTLKNLHYEFR